MLATAFQEITSFTFVKSAKIFDIRKKIGRSLNVIGFVWIKYGDENIDERFLNNNEIIALASKESEYFLR